MNRSRRPLLAILILIVLGLAIYYLAGGARYEGQFFIEKPAEPQDFMLETQKPDGQIYAIELVFKGELSGDATLTIGIPGNPYYVRKTLKAGVIDTRYKGDWYYEQCPIRYEPKDDNIEGRLLIKYRFIRI
jgi:hypothetical protein